MIQKPVLVRKWLVEFVLKLVTEILKPVLIDKTFEILLNLWLSPQEETYILVIHFTFWLSILNFTGKDSCPK